METLEKIVDKTPEILLDIKGILARHSCSRIYGVSGCELNFTDSYGIDEARRISDELGKELSQYNIKADIVERSANRETPVYSITLFSNDGPSRDLLNKIREKYFTDED